MTLVSLREMKSTLLRRAPFSYDLANVIAEVIPFGPTEKITKRFVIALGRLF